MLFSMQEPYHYKVIYHLITDHLQLDQDHMIRVIYLKDTKNVINVYSRSGNAYDDGFLTDPALSSEIVAANGQTYVDLYRNVNLENRQHYMTDFGFDVFATPQIVKMGVAVNF